MQSVSKEMLQFLEKLKVNNNREWFDEHKPEFKSLEADIKLFYNEVSALLQKHDRIEKTKAFRIYRDVRFSKNKTPYKQHVAASFTRKKPALRGGYYLHLQPDNKSLIAVGFWAPNKEDLKRIRKELEIDASDFRAILQDKNLRKYWNELQGETLKTAPRGFDKTHKNIDLINHKQFTFSKNFTDKEVLQPNFAEVIDEHYKAIRPFFDYMSEILTTDLNGRSLID
ncbi:DUF2461 domain-containing protein [Mesonia ostreae]|uniref:DUF2461 domain-containing protein n=1 Tax=Mesonia ostreae TaxID=861110 RepID=A0ABU2KJY5_9FLAO|nr:DUF2461 domain-containing protein [Mesonia ostreae]MDT0295020.1 DUF2461 domain-containing protein [Mesonia ostreae]